MIDPHTFGKSPAAEILAARLNEIGDSKLTRRVSAFLHHTLSGFAALSDVKDDKRFVEFVVLWRKSRMAKIGFHERLDSLVGSTITGVARDWIRTTAQEEQDDD